ncbi:MAG: UvrD-helicase domain-containing protein [Synergistaceae bacterium]|jgi:ATP-dependent exoDNAse (exonuclease V) beta subunit|nr:UvrD-helicase domain-containing protein [Synergistaceae bacterium]
MIDQEILLDNMRAEQREAIKSLAPLTVVSAGAGTGKTMTLARRFAWLLASDPECQVDQILTLTFTNAAAAEMRERIAKTLTEWREMGVERLDDALERLNEAYISTIDSFALRVIRESGINLDIDPDSRIMGKPLEAEFWNGVKWKLSTGAALNDGDFSLPENADFAAFVGYYGAGTLSALGRAACDLYGSMNEGPAYLGEWNEEAERPAREYIRDIYSSLCHEVWELWRNTVFPAIKPSLGIKSASASVARLRDFVAAWEGHPGGADDEARFFASLVCDVLRGFRCGDALKQAMSEQIGNVSEWANGYRPYAEAVASILSVPYYSATEARTRDILSKTAAALWESWNADRISRGVLIFSDLARYAAVALSRDASYASRFRHIMIDEFQDTNELQDSIIRSLSESWPQDGAARTAFIVGDIKQSIYRFRHANPRIFAEYFAKSRYIPMSRSYRMSGRLMESINLVFGSIWADGVLKNARHSAVYEPLSPPLDAPWWEERNAPPCPECPLEILLCPPREPAPSTVDGKKPEREKKSARRKKLAFGLASRLYCLMHSQSEVWDKRTVSFRPMRWNDIAVLVRSRTPFPEIEDAFRSAGIPFVLCGAQGFLSRSEVRDIIGFLRVLDRPSDELALAGWIESPFSMMPSGRALKLKAFAMRNGTSLREEFEKNCPEQALKLSRVRNIARFRSPSAALGTLLEDDRWLGAYPGASRARVLANVERGVELAELYEDSCGRALPACAEYLERELRAGAKMEEPEGTSGGGDALSVMTVHASKGLEFPVVALMYMESTKGGKGFGPSAAASRYMGAIARKLPDGEASVRYKWHEAIEESEESDEDERLLYVAMTRAQERLICCGLPEFADKRGRDWLSLLTAANERNGNPFSVSLAAPHAESDALWKEKDSSREQTQTQADEPPKTRSWTPRLATLSATAYSLISWCPRAYRIRYRQGRELRWGKSSGGGVGGADLGTMTHWVLQRWDFDPMSLRSLLPGEIQSDEMEEALTEVPPHIRHVWRKRANRNACRRWIEDFAVTPASAELRRAMENGTLRREVSFFVKSDLINLVGTIDVFWLDREGYHIRDWKITPEDDAPHELYAAQLEFYAAACDAVYTGSRIDAGLIYLRSPGRQTSSGIVNEWEEIRASIGKAAETAVSGGTKRGNCTRCPFVSACTDSICAEGTK